MILNANTISLQGLASMLPGSRLLSFINHQQGFSLNFLEGSKLIEDLALIHAQNIQGFSYLRDFVLLGQLLGTYLKHNESIGIFIDSEDPYLRLKLEISSIGDSRTLLLPELLENIPQKVNGYCRLVKVSPHQSEPYTSFIRLENVALSEAISLALLKSYQIEARALTSRVTDQSLMLTKLPEIQVDKQVRENRPDASSELSRLRPELEALFAAGFTDEQAIIKDLERLGFDYLSGRDIRLHCNCEQSRMVSGIASLAHSESLDALYEKEQSLEVKCDYCKKTYQISKREVEEFIRNSNS